MIILGLLLAAATAASPEVVVSVKPDAPWLEPGRRGLQLNFDLVVENKGTEKLRIDDVQVDVLDDGGRLVSMRMVGTNGPSPSIQTVPNREVAPGDWVMVFNPFVDWDEDVLPNRMRYTFTLHPAAEQRGGREVKATVEVKPRLWAGATKLMPPVKGRVLVWDGHDALSHHRRWDLGHPMLRSIGMKNNPSRYAYDLSVIDESGAMHKGDGKEPEDWFGFGTGIVAPGAGTVVAVRNEAPDRGPDKVDWKKVPQQPDLTWGNHVVIDHGQGEWSALMHLQQGSVTVKVGDKVTPGQPIAKMGFSGDAFTVHLHYQLQSGPGFDVEGLPSVFHGFKRVLGARTVPVERGTIDSGDVYQH
jgi:hypothetical protein